MQFNRARFLSTASTIHQGASGMLVLSSMSSLALVYISQRRLDLTSIGLSFHCLSGSWIRMRKRNSCSSSVIENQYLIRMVPERTSILSNAPRSPLGALCLCERKPDRVRRRPGLLPALRGLGWRQCRELLMPLIQPSMGSGVPVRRHFPREHSAATKPHVSRNRTAWS